MKRLLRGLDKAVFERSLPGFLKEQRWFGGKARTIRCASLLDVALIGPESVIVLAAVRYTDGGAETYALPLTLPDGPKGAWTDACADPSFGRSVLDAIRKRRTLPALHGTVRAERTRAFARLSAGLPKRILPQPLRGQQSNSSIVLGKRLLVKLYRRAAPSVNPEIEIGRFLTKRGFAHAPALAGWLEYRRRGRTIPLAILQAFVLGGRDFWEFTLGELRRPSGAYPKLAALLGRRTAQLHLALGSGKWPDFAPEPFTASYRRELRAGMRAQSKKALRLLRERLHALPKSACSEAANVLAAEGQIGACLDSAFRLPIDARRIRCHGDLHLGQVLFTGKDLVFIDFEGEPARSPSERRLKRSPLYDAAGMLRSFHYAAQSVRFERRSSGAAAERLAAQASAAFIKAYLSCARAGGFLPADPVQIRALLDAFCLEKALYELIYELNNRPAWVRIPLRGILRLLKESSGGGPESCKI